MVKHFVLIPKRDDVSTEHFHDHWRDNHSELALMIRTLVRYTQSHRQDPPPAGWRECSFDGIAECGFATLADAYGLSTNPDYTGNAKEDDPNFIDVEALGFFTCEEPIVVREGPVIARDTPGVKAMALLSRRADLEPADFQRKLEDAAPDLADLQPEAHTVLLCLPVLETYGMDPAPSHDAILEFYYDDRDAYDGAWKRAGAALHERLSPLLDEAGTSAGPYEEIRFKWPTADELVADTADQR